MILFAVANAFLMRAAGYGVKWASYGLILLSGVYSLLVASWWQAGLVMLAVWAVGTLPITLFGNSVNNDYPWGFAWVWIEGYIYGLPAVLLHGWNGLLYAVVPCVAFGLGTTLSNVKSTAKIFTWEFVEGIKGFSVMIALMGVWHG